jgi:hypothetical protein
MQARSRQLSIGCLLNGPTVTNAEHSNRNCEFRQHSRQWRRSRRTCVVAQGIGGRGESGAGVAARQVRDGAFGSAGRLLKIDYGRCSYPHCVRQSRSGVRRAAQGGGTQGDPVGQAAALEYLPDARGGRRRRCGRRLARSHRAHDSGRLWTGHRRPSHCRVSGVRATSIRTELGHLRIVRRPPQMTRPAWTYAQSGFFLVELRGLEPLAEQGKRALHLRRCSETLRLVPDSYQRLPVAVLTASTRQASWLRPDKVEPASTSPQR